MPLPILITDLSTTAASNYPSGSESPAVLDDVQRAHAAFIAQLRDGASGANSSITSLTGLTTALSVSQGGTGSTTAVAARAAFGVAPRAARIDVASVAGVVDLTANAPDTDDIRLTGALTVTGFTVAIGRRIYVVAGGASTLTDNASIVTNKGANIVCAAGDSYVLRATAANVVEVLEFSPAELARPLTRMANVATTSGTTKELTGFPADVDLITLSLRDVSTNGSDVLILRLSYGGYAPTGYAGTSFNMTGASYPSTAGIPLRASAPGNTVSGHVLLTHMGSNVWVISGVVGSYVNDQNVILSSSIALSGPLDGIQLLTSGLVDTFDGGSMGAMYQQAV